MLSWIAHYNDGSALPQWDGDRENRYENIDIARLAGFEVRDEEKVVLFLHIPSGGRLIYRQRVEKSPGMPDVRVWLVGVQSTQRGVNSQYVCAIFPDRHLEIVDRFVEGTGWFYPPELHAHEAWAF